MAGPSPPRTPRSVGTVTTSRTNEEWLADLQPESPRREAAIRDLRDYLMRAVLVYLTRHRSDVAGLDYDEIQQMAEDWAQQGVLQVLDRSASFRGDSKFTTWAYRVAINLVAGDLRRKHWETVSLDALTESSLPDSRWTEDGDQPSPEDELARSELWAAVQSVIHEDLTPRQRTVLTQVVLHGVPVDVVAEQMNTNRNNIYKIIHDARRKLRQELALRDWSTEDVMAAFQTQAH